MKFIGYNFISVLLIILAGYMVYTDKSNWGWVIFAALLCASVPKYKKNDKDKK